MIMLVVSIVIIEIFCFMSEKDIVDLKEYKNLEFLEEESVD